MEVVRCRASTPQFNAESQVVGTLSLPEERPLSVVRLSFAGHHPANRVPERQSSTIAGYSHFGAEDDDRAVMMLCCWLRSCNKMERTRRKRHDELEQKRSSTRLRAVWTSPACKSTPSGGARACRSTVPLRKRKSGKQTCSAEFVIFLASSLFSTYSFTNASCASCSHSLM
ncbi:hypothetical protein TGRUB_264100 [Toxoplasma gondii RUB]|uniref:Uncharacterized protein n=1 Tax=Toxoplasma gondii RUB TaxID=935652 RepID=A0A086LKN8_TOXGO|nr:hypothetical protein TGRUB_264100 [Toxoplasma gondii RUB]